jgi:choline kinase
LFPPGSPPSSSLGPKEKEERDKAMSELDKEVSYWSPASHAVWALWGLIQARDDVSNWDGIEEGIGGEFDYLGYAVGRMEGFRRELVERGICASSSGSKA